MDTSQTLAKANFANFIHEMHWISEHGDMSGCGRKNMLVYLLLNARKDSYDLITEEHRPGPSILKDLASVYYMDVSELYSYGYDKIDPTDYANLKQDVKNWFAKLHEPFKSWEKP